jgi:GT2 family glycosyltransferase
MLEHVGVVVIGRNEGELLPRALASVAQLPVVTLYVDSGSSDGSAQLAASMGVAVHELDPATPFSAARARREGTELLLKTHPATEWVQFLDGDCVLEPAWLDRALAYLLAHPDVGIVCGLLSEAAPERSPYSRFMALHWKASAGEVDACGGIFLCRRSAYDAVGGFNSRLLTGEEAEFCQRLRSAGHRIIRLDEAMARHDSDMSRFSEWWQRAVWGGFGDALEFHVLKGKVRPQRLSQTLSSFLWGVCVPLAAVLGGLGMMASPWFVIVPVLCLAGYARLFLRLRQDRMQRGDSSDDASFYSLFCILRKLPVAIGFMHYWLKPGARVRRPDPHAALTRAGGTAK